MWINSVICKSWRNWLLAKKYNKYIWIYLIIFKREKFSLTCNQLTESFPSYQLAWITVRWSTHYIHTATQARLEYSTFVMQPEHFVLFTFYCLRAANCSPEHLVQSNRRFWHFANLLTAGNSFQFHHHPHHHHHPEQQQYHHYVVIVSWKWIRHRLRPLREYKNN